MAPHEATTITYRGLLRASCRLSRRLGLSDPKASNDASSFRPIALVAPRYVHKDRAYAGLHLWIDVPTHLRYNPHPRDYAPQQINRDHSYCIGQLAIFQVGGAYVPLHTKLPRAEARYILEDSSCRQALVHPQFRPALEPDLRALGVEIVELPPSAGGLDAEEAGEEEEEIEFVEGGPVRPSTDAMVIYTRCGIVCGMGKGRNGLSLDFLLIE